MSSKVLTKLLNHFLKTELKDVVRRWGYLNEKLFNQSEIENQRRPVVDWSSNKKAIIDKIADISDKLPLEAVGELDILYISKHYHRKTWSTFYFKTSEDDAVEGFSSAGKLFSKLYKQFHKIVKADVAAKRIDNMIWIRIYIHHKDKKKDKYLPSNTVYMVHYVNTPIIVLSQIKASHSKAVHKALLAVFDGGRSKDLHLSGRNAYTLLQLAINKYCAGDIEIIERVRNDENFKPKKRERTEISEEEYDETIMDEFQVKKKRRLEYLDKTFGENEQPGLEKLDYKLETRFRGNKVVPRMKQYRDIFQCKVTFSGDNVLEGIRSLVRSGIIDSQTDHLVQIHQRARNNFTLENKPSSTTGESVVQHVDSQQTPS